MDDKSTANSLLEELRVPTNNTVPDSQNTAASQPASENTLDANDFNLEHEEPSANEEPTPYTDDEPLRVVQDPISFLGSAKRITKMFSSVLSIIGKRVYPAKIIRDTDWAIHQELEAKMALDPSHKMDIFNNEALLNPEIFACYERFEQCRDLIKEAPLSQEEIDDIAEPLAEVMAKYNALQVGPEASLAFAIFIVMVPRIEPLIPGFRDIMQGVAGRVKAAA